MADVLAAYRAVHVDDDAVHELLNDPDGPVGQLLIELSERAAATARRLVPVRREASKPWIRTTAHYPGYTLRTIHPHVAYDNAGLIYGGVNAAASPSIFLEYPAVQMHRRYPFLTTAMDSLEI